MRKKTALKPGTPEAWLVANQPVAGSLYEAITAAGIPTDHHESDLYFPVTVESTAVLHGYPGQKAIAETFMSQTDGAMWYDVPFAFLPFWEKAAKEIRATEPKADEREALLIDALRQAWELLSHSDVKFHICNGGRGNLGEAATYGRAEAAKRKVQAMGVTL